MVLDVDPTRFVQVISNLLDNALKYTDPGGQVRIAAELTQDSERAMLVLKLSDSGVGIAAALLPQIFEPFTRGDDEARHAQGLGIGLALTRRLIEMHGGSIDAHSKGLNQGSEFTIRLPIVTDIPVADAVQPGPKATRINRRIAVIDDDVDVAKSIARFISALGGEPRVAHNGEDGLALMRDFRPDVVVLDIGMPKMDGFATCRRIREEFGSGVFVVAMTGWGSEEDKQAALCAGFDAHNAKPPKPEELTPTAWRAPATRSVSPAPPTPMPPMATDRLGSGAPPPSARVKWANSRSARFLQALKPGGSQPPVPHANARRMQGADTICKTCLLSGDFPGRLGDFMKSLLVSTAAVLLSAGAPAARRSRTRTASIRPGRPMRSRPSLTRDKASAEAMAGPQRKFRRRPLRRLLRLSLKLRSRRKPDPRDSKDTKRRRPLRCRRQSRRQSGRKSRPPRFRRKPAQRRSRGIKDMKRRHLSRCRR